MTGLFVFDRRNGLDCGGVWRMVPANQLGSDVVVERTNLTDDNGNPVRVQVPRHLLVAYRPADARATDPATARDAAALQTEPVKRASHRLVLTLLAKWGPMTDHQLAERMSRDVGRHIGHDNAGKRRLEMKRVGFVEKTGTTAPTPSGGEAEVYRISSAGKRELANWSINPPTSLEEAS
jgi:DNA-binding PadR family transcriptional regulator